ncbi:xylulokinase [Tuanshanicoccus lijuaniae]|uniref:xylulokinase n=1 Tax=Aerococcaceae bacterium zg-1292 TaxID=2774330 RepID=UPI001BD84916|nr:FGGY-family carbohydrate kinase [Aerococcaceae bacterium zg-A91]MBS4457322.1 FGGY-family carbohydrate kinase [Aerococcaceae bacterium zg-BR33]
MTQVTQLIKDGKTALGIELGSTRIKAILIDECQNVIASGNFDWENQLKEGIWTYDLNDVWMGIQAAYAQLVSEIKQQYGIHLTTIGSIGISAMMHGYLAFDKDNHLLVPFRTWRNTITTQAANVLSGNFKFNIPERWSIAHVYQAILNKEQHVSHIAYLTTLAGYVHWRLTGEKVLGVGDASGMFPIDAKTSDYREDFLNIFDNLIESEQVPWQLRTLLPKVLSAGQFAGTLTQEGANQLDPTGILTAGIPLCPPEGDAGTGMVATNSILPKTGNVSAGTSIFSMVVLDRDLVHQYPEIDIVTTPVGDNVAMVHANNCSSDINAWVKMFHEYSQLIHPDQSLNDTYTLLFNQALEGEKDCGEILSIGYFSGESITKVDKGRPLVIRTPESRLTIGNLMRSHIFSAFATLAIGMDILTEKEQINIEQILGHGGIFKTPKIAQTLLAASINTPVSVMETAGEGGAWGIALLADYLNHTEMSLAAYLDDIVFKNTSVVTVQPDTDDVTGFTSFKNKFKAAISIEKIAGEIL